MNINIKKENIKRYVAAVTLAAIVGTPLGLMIGCRKTDHTKELCPITKTLNMLPDYENPELGYSIPKGAKHQINKMAEDYLEKDDKMMVYATYGEITYPEIFEKSYLDGTVEVYEGKYSKGECGITSHLEDGSEEYLIFEEGNQEYSSDFPEFKLVRTNRSR